MGNTANTSFPSRRDLTGTSCSSLSSLRATTLKSAKALVHSVWLFLHYFTNPSYCPIKQSEFCSRQRPQKWSNRGLYSRRSLPSSSPLCFFSEFSSSSPPLPLYIPATQANQVCAVSVEHCTDIADTIGSNPVQAYDVLIYLEVLYITDGSKISQHLCTKSNMVSYLTAFLIYWLERVLYNRCRIKDFVLPRFRTTRYGKHSVNYRGPFLCQTPSLLHPF